MYMYYFKPKQTNVCLASKNTLITTKTESVDINNSVRNIQKHEQKYFAKKVKVCQKSFQE